MVDIYIALGIRDGEIDRINPHIQLPDLTKFWRYYDSLPFVGLESNLDAETLLKLQTGFKSIKIIGALGELCVAGTVADVLFEYDAQIKVPADFVFFKPGNIFDLHYWVDFHISSSTTYNHQFKNNVHYFS